MYDSLNNDVSLCEFQLSGQESVIKISDFLDKVVLIVNTASECGLCWAIKIS